MHRGDGLVVSSGGVQPTVGIHLESIWAGTVCMRITELLCSLNVMILPYVHNGVLRRLVGRGSVAIMLVTFCKPNRCNI